MEFLTKPWPWYIGGPLIGLMVPLLLLLGNKTFGISSSLRHICAACLPGQIDFFQYNWKKESWNLLYASGILIGGIIAGQVFANPNPVNISSEAIKDISAFHVTDFSGMHPKELFNFHALLTVKGFVLMILGGFFVGFGTRYAGGCTSGHSIMGISNLQVPSMIATCCFFIGGLIMTWFILPYIMQL
jgi:uncharacterized membrane protein YedE/YeeE